MTTLDRYLMGQTVGVLVKTLLTFAGLFVLIDYLTDLRTDAATHNVPWLVVAQYYLYFSPHILFEAAPLAMLVAGLLVLGKAAEHNEVTAALAGGISLYRLVWAPVLVAFVFALVSFGLEEGFGARAIAEADRLERNYFGQRRDDLRQSQSWVNLEGGWTCHIMKYNRLANTGEQAILHRIGSDAVEQILADRIFWDEAEGQWYLEDGRWVVFDAEVNAILEDHRITQRPAPIEESPQALFAIAEPPETKRAAELAEDIRWAEGRGIPTHSLWVDYHVKFSRPALSFVMIWLAIPFALRLRRGGLAISFGASIIIAIVYLLVFSVSTAFGHVGQIPPVVAAWLPNVLFLAGGIALFSRTST